LGGAPEWQNLKERHKVAGDKKNVLTGDSFDSKETKDGKVLLYHNGRLVETLTGAAAAKFSKRMASADHRTGQLLIAKATKNFKRGNEKVKKP